MLEPSMQRNTTALIARMLKDLDPDRVRANLDSVAENVYQRLPSGDYGRGDVRAAIVEALDEGAKAPNLQGASEPPAVGSPSPWGTVEVYTAHPNGCVSVSTASHGGVWVPPDRLECIPPKLRAYGARWSKGWGEQWYEEDIAAVAPMHYVEGCKAAGDYLPQLRKLAEGGAR
jgi:hypothetical protein